MQKIQQVFKPHSLQGKLCILDHDSKWSYSLTLHESKSTYIRFIFKLRWLLMSPPLSVIARIGLNIRHACYNWLSVTQLVWWNPVEWLPGKHFNWNQVEILISKFGNFGITISTITLIMNHFWKYSSEIVYTQFSRRGINLERFGEQLHTKTMLSGAIYWQSCWHTVHLP